MAVQFSNVTDTGFFTTTHLPLKSNWSIGLFAYWGVPANGIYSIVTQLSNQPTFENGYEIFLTGDTATSYHIEIFCNAGANTFMVTPASSLSAGVWNFIGFTALGTAGTTMWKQVGRGGFRFQSSTVGTLDVPLQLDVGQSYGGDTSVNGIAGYKVWGIPLPLQTLQLESEQFGPIFKPGLLDFWGFNTLTSLTDAVNGNVLAVHGAPAVTQLAPPPVLNRFTRIHPATSLLLAAANRDALFFGSD
jgi:hypothetical protein